MGNGGGGQQLLQELPKLGFQIAQGVEPEHDKQMRMASQTAILANGFVHVPEDAAWLAEYLHEMAVFPNGKYDDQVDSTSQFLIWHNNIKMTCWNVFEHTRREAERVHGLKPKVEPREPPSMYRHFPRSNAPSARIGGNADDGALQ